MIARNFAYWKMFLLGSSNVSQDFLEQEIWLLHRSFALKVTGQACFKSLKGQVHKRVSLKNKKKPISFY
jgi:hypothetical protein